MVAATSAPADEGMTDEAVADEGMTVEAVADEVIPGSFRVSGCPGPGDPETRKGLSIISSPHIPHRI